MADIFGSCTYCQEEINGVRVQCCECVDFDLCLQCFSSGAEIGPHKNDHSYRFVDQCAVSIFGGRGNWTAREQLQLLDVMELFGFGNWEYITRHITTRTPEEVRDEYVNRYLDGSIGKVTWSEIGDRRPILPEHPPQDRGPLAPEVTSRLPPLNATPEEARQLGYMALRDDFEREYDIEAEQLVSPLQLKMNEDTEMEIALKLAKIDMYTRRLRERCRRKRVVRDYQIVANFFSSQRKDGTKKPFTKEQREFRDNMRIFSQFLTSGEHERLIDSIERERELRHRLSELIRYRSLGLTTQEEIIHYEQHVAYQRQQMRQNRAGSSGYGITTQEHLSENGREEAETVLLEERFVLLGEDPTNSSNNNPSNIQPPPVTSLPQGFMLSHQEAQLCSSLNLQPIQYRIMKSHIIQDNILSNGKSKTNEESLANGNELNIKDAVTKYLSVSGWLPSLSVI